ncbi:MAG: hypothetical protein JSU61_06730 [Fidelibacterota bacterium]|nr:MAG: hypothetical protein JSU61_06730 [Candidatus Neomarinimicrobiota bacterium]
MKTCRKRFSHEMREEAFELYSQGLATLRVVRVLEERHGADQAPSYETVRRWAHLNDWWERRERIRQEAARRLDDERAEKLARLIKQFEDLRQATFKICSKQKYRSMEGVVRSLDILQRNIDDLRGQEGSLLRREDLDDIVDMIFELLGEDEEVGPVLARRQVLIAERIDEKLLGKQRVIEPGAG